MPSTTCLYVTGLEHTCAASGITSNGTEPIQQHAISSTATRGWIDTGYAGKACMYTTILLLCNLLHMTTTFTENKPDPNSHSVGVLLHCVRFYDVSCISGVLTISGAQTPKYGSPHSTHIIPTYCFPVPMIATSRYVTTLRRHRYCAFSSPSFCPRICFLSLLTGSLRLTHMDFSGVYLNLAPSMYHYKVLSFVPLV